MAARASRAVRHVLDGRPALVNQDRVKKGLDAPVKLARHESESPLVEIGLRVSE